MTDLKFKEVIKAYLNSRLEELVNKPCFIDYKDKYIFQENKYSNASNEDIYNISNIDLENKIITISNVKNSQISLFKTKIFVNYNIDIEVYILGDNKIKFKNEEDIYLVAIGDIVTLEVDRQENKIYIITDVDNVRTETNTISSTHNNIYYDVNIFIGSNDYTLTRNEFDFFYEEIIRIFNEQSFNVTYKYKNLDIFTVNKPRYRSVVKTENDRVGYIILRLSHFYNNKIRI